MAESRRVQLRFATLRATREYLWAHVVLALLLVKLTFLLGSGILVLLVLRDKIVHVALSLRELHFVHALASVPVQEGLAAEHGREVLGHALEHFLDSSAVTSERDRHLQALWRDITDRRFDVVRNPLNEVGAVLVLHVK